MINDDMFGSLNSISRMLETLEKANNFTIPKLNAVDVLTKPMAKIAFIQDWEEINPVKNMLQGINSMISNDWLKQYDNHNSFYKYTGAKYNYNPIGVALKTGIIQALNSTKVNFSNDLVNSLPIKNLSEISQMHHSFFSYPLTPALDLLSSVSNVTNIFKEQSAVIKLITKDYSPVTPNFDGYLETIKQYKENSKKFKDNLQRLKFHSQSDDFSQEVETVVSEFVANADTIQIDNDNLETAVFNHFMQVLNSLLEEFFKTNLNFEKIKLLLLSPSMIFLTYTTSILATVSTSPKTGKKNVEYSLLEKCDAIAISRKEIKINPDDRYKVYKEIFKGERLSVIEIANNKKWLKVRILQDGKTFDGWTRNLNLKKL